MKRALLLAPAFLSACAAPTARPAPVPVAPVLTGIGLERVLGQDAAGLVRLFGEPDADLREGEARKLQFESGICVLDTYLYPKNGAEPRVTYLDAREPDGSPIDRASCVAAMTRRGAAR
ncbi:MAG TPA: hypothetical protein VF592_06975 [Sphingomonas sp.]|jgi:hypothetical protein|uniref:hypothetical protein n=1 Tax=Sphingomonas sp. TaxID=28214 RepID=UPI002EDBA19C